VYRFLLSRRWLCFALLMLVVAIACVQLSTWQFDRQEARRASNAVIERNLAAPPADITELSGVGDVVPAELAWRRVRATGSFDASHQILVRYQHRGGQLGYDVVTPLVTADGPALLVVRGFVAAREATTVPVVPAPPLGQVRVTGWLRADQSGDDAQVRPESGQVRLVSSPAIAATLPYPVYGGYVEMTAVQPEPAVTLVGPEPPELGSGPHFFYGLQWLFFAALAVGGWIYLAWSEPRTPRPPPVTATAPAVREDAAAR
jgi:cytochrome oxidase assembly protein ShyY1